MATDTNLSLQLKCEDLIDGIDKSAAKVEEFSNRAEKAFDSIDKSAVHMSEAQRRVLDQLSKSNTRHQHELAKIKDEYEALRKKKQEGNNLSREEYARLEELSKKYKTNAGAIATNAKQLEQMSRNFKALAPVAKQGFNAMDAAASAIGGTIAIMGAKLTSFVADTLREIASAGLQTQQTISQFAAMRNNLSDATATYQMFNDVARNTNYDFESVNEMGKQLLNMGYSAKNAADLIQLCSDTAAGLGQGVSGAQQLVQVISRIQSTGELSSKQLVNLQMAGIDTDKVFAKVGMTSDEAMEALKKGTLDSQKAISLLTDYMHEFDGSMNKSKQNLKDMWGDVTGNIATACGEIGASISDAFMKSEIVQDLIDFTQALIDLVRGDGTGAWRDLGAAADEVLGFIAATLKSIETIIKAVIIVVTDLYGAFRDMCSNVYEYLYDILNPIAEIYSYIKGLLKAMGKGVSDHVDSVWKRTFRAPERETDDTNHFKPKAKTASTSKSGTKLSEEEKQVEALIKKYADASKQAQERGKIALQIAGLNASMLVGEAKQREELNNKITAFEENHRYVIDGYKEELKLAQQIADAKVRESTVAGINAQIKAQNELFNKQVEVAKWQSEFAKLQNSDRTLVDMFFGDPESVQAKIGTIKARLSDFMTEINALQASAGEEGMGAEGLNGLSSQSSGFLTQILKKTPEELAAEYEAKKEQFSSFADFIKNKMAEAAAAETQNLTIGEQWKQKQVQWVGDIGMSMGKAVADWIMGAKSIGQAMKEMVKNLISQAVQLLAQWTMVFALVSAFSNPKTGVAAANKMVLGIGDWNGQKLATGGFVSGPGTSTSDSIPAMLSDGEYVLNAAAVRAVGVGNLDALNYGRTPGYSNEGMAMGAGAGSRSVSVSISALDPTSFSEFLGRGGLNSIKQALFEDDRQFSSNVGVW